jgi:hypothetical protein
MVQLQVLDSNKFNELKLIHSSWFLLDPTKKTTQIKSSLWLNHVMLLNTCLLWWLPCVPRDQGPCPKPFYMHGVNMSFLWNLLFLWVLGLSFTPQ